MNNKLNIIKTPPSIEIADMVRKMTVSGEKIAAMQTGEPYFSTPYYIKKALEIALKKNYTHYSSSRGIPELFKSIAEYYKNRYSVTINPNEILISCGAIGSIYTLYSGFFNIGEELIIIEPAWPQYANIALMQGVKVNRISTINTKGRLTPELLEKAITNSTKMVVINNPCNPSGIVYSEDEINSFIKIAAKHKLYLLFDEVYSEITYDVKFQSVLKCELYEQNKQKIIYVNSFSKTFAMTGWRIGYAFLPPDILFAALKVSQNSITNVSTFSQYAAAVALDEKHNHESVFTEMNKIYNMRYAELLDLYQKKNIQFLYPEGAFYFFINCGIDGLIFAKQLLENDKIAVVPGAAYGLDFSKYYRISFAVDEYSYQQYINWLKKK